jgi:hypothetical protein
MDGLGPPKLADDEEGGGGGGADDEEAFAKKGVSRALFMCLLTTSSEALREVFNPTSPGETTIGDSAASTRCV